MGGVFLTIGFNAMRYLFTIVSILLLPAAAHALTFQERQIVCPIGGEKFSETLPASGTAYGRYFDTRPFGAIMSPWPLAKCPGNGFVLFKGEFSREEISKLEPFVLSDEYQRIKSSESSYYLASRLMTLLGAPKRDVAYMLVQASWEGATSRYQTLALEHYQAALAEPYDDHNKWSNDQLIAGELERRLGRFTEARQRFLALSENGRLSDPELQRVANLQLEMISRSDSSDQRIPEKTHD